MTVFEKCAKNVLDRCYGLKISPVKTLVHCHHWDLVTTRFTVRYYLLFSTHPLHNTVPPAMVVSGGQHRLFIFLIWSTHCRLHFGNQTASGEMQAERPEWTGRSLHLLLVSRMKYRVPLCGSKWSSFLLHSSTNIQPESIQCIKRSFDSTTDSLVSGWKVILVTHPSV